MYKNISMCSLNVCLERIWVLIASVPDLCILLLLLPRFEKTGFCVFGKFNLQLGALRRLQHLIMKVTSMQ